MIKLGRYSYNATDDIKCYEGVLLNIGDFCSIGSGLNIYSGEHPNMEHPELVSQYPFHEQWHIDYPKSKLGGFVNIGSDVWIATDVSILEGVTIGDGAIIAAGSMVTKDVEPYALVAGNPAQVKKHRFSPEIIEKLLTIKWWSWDDESISKAIPHMKNVEEFVERYG